MDRKWLILLALGGCAAQHQPVGNMPVVEYVPPPPAYIEYDCYTDTIGDMPIQVCKPK